MDITTIVIIVLLAVIVGLGLLLYKTVNRRNQTSEVLAEVVRDLARQNAGHSAMSAIQENPKTETINK